MARLEEIAERDGWRCWLCDEPVDPDMPSSDPRGASVDQRTTKKRAKKKSARPQPERLAHRACNTGKGGTAPEVPWPVDLFVIDPVDIIGSVDRLARKGGREVMGRCTTADDAAAVATWLDGRLGRLEPELGFRIEVSEGGGQFLVSVLSD